MSGIGAKNVDTVTLKRHTDGLDEDMLLLRDRIYGKNGILGQMLSGEMSDGAFYCVDISACNKTMQD